MEKKAAIVCWCSGKFLLAALFFYLKTKFIFLSYPYNHHLLERKTNQRYAAHPSNVRIFSTLRHFSVGAALAAARVTVRVTSTKKGKHTGPPFQARRQISQRLTWALRAFARSAGPSENSDLLAQYPGLEPILCEVLL